MAAAPSLSSLVLSVEKPYLEGFLEGLRKLEEIRARVPSLVLLALNGGDQPLTREMQELVLAVPSIKACFGNNMHEAIEPTKFFPLPIGLPHHADGVHRGKLHGLLDGEQIVASIRAAALPWSQRDPRLLVAPMSKNRIRHRLKSTFSQPEFRDLVRVVSETVDFAAFLKMIAEHKFVLSPPGKGFDCYRTWQALAVGTAPLVVQDPAFDARLYTDFELTPLPRTGDLTADELRTLLSSVRDPTSQFEKLQVKHWKKVWDSFLD